MSFLFQPKYWKSVFVPHGYSVADMPDMCQKVAIVTGANTGLGYASMVALAAKGAHVFLACRNREKAEEAIERARIEIKLLRAANFKRQSTSSKAATSSSSTGSSTSFASPAVLKEKASRLLNKRKRHNRVSGQEGLVDNSSSQEQQQQQQQQQQHPMMDENDNFEDDGFEAKLEFLPLDLNDVNKCRAAAQEFVARGLPLHILMNNAGVMDAFGLSANGVEHQFAVNYLGHFVFTLGLLDVLKASQPSRVVILSSYMHEYSRGLPDFDQLTTCMGHSALRLYSRSMQANILFAKALARRVEGDQVYVNVVNPGCVKTDLTRHADRAMSKNLQKVSRLFEKLAALPAERGCETQLYVATSPEIETNNCRGRYFVKTADEIQPRKLTKDIALQEKLWLTSSKLVQETLGLYELTFPVVLPRSAGVPLGAGEDGGASGTRQQQQATLNNNDHSNNNISSSMDNNPNNPDRINNNHLKTEVSTELQDESAVLLQDGRRVAMTGPMMVMTNPNSEIEVQAEPKEHQQHHQFEQHEQQAGYSNDDNKGHGNIGRIEGDKQELVGSQQAPEACAAV